MGENVKQITDVNFESEVLKSDVPVLVDFWAAWCMPCRFVAPVVEELSKEYEGKIKVAKMDVDKNPQSAGKYGISSIPTILLFHDGKVVDGVIGAVPKETLKKIVDKHLIPTA